MRPHAYFSELGSVPRVIFYKGAVLFWGLMGPSSKDYTHIDTCGVGVAFQALVAASSSWGFRCVGFFRVQGRRGPGFMGSVF